MWNPVKEAEKAAKRAVNKIVNPAVDAAKRAVNRLGDQVKSGVRNVGREAEAGIKKSGREIEKTFEKKIPELVTKKLPDALANELPKALKQIAVDLAKDLGKPGFKSCAKLARQTNIAFVKFNKRRPGLTAALDEQSLDIELKAAVAVGISISGMFTRGATIAGILDRYANQGMKARRRDIVGFVRVIAPTSASLGAEAELSIGITIGASGKITLTGNLIAELLDMILEEGGVPQ